MKSLSINNIMSDFQYQVSVNIPVDINNVKLWFNTLNTIEHWINNHIGPHQLAWTYIHNSNSNLTIGFTNPEYKTFFLLYYS